MSLVSAFSNFGKQKKQAQFLKRLLMLAQFTKWLILKT